MQTRRRMHELMHMTDCFAHLKDSDLFTNDWSTLNQCSLFFFQHWSCPDLLQICGLCTCLSLSVWFVCGIWRSSLNVQVFSWSLMRLSEEQLDHMSWAPSRSTPREKRICGRFHAASPLFSEAVGFLTWTTLSIICVISVLMKDVMRIWPVCRDEVQEFIILQNNLHSDVCNYGMESVSIFRDDGCYQALIPDQSSMWPTRRTALMHFSAGLFGLSPDTLFVLSSLNCVFKWVAHFFPCCMANSSWLLSFLFRLFFSVSLYYSVCCVSD